MPTRLLVVLLSFLCCTQLTASAPAGVFGQHSNAGLSNSLSNITSNFTSLPKSNASNSDLAICHVRQTRTVLIIRLLDNHRLDPTPMSLTIDAAKSYVKRTIDVRGDGWLPPSKDPFQFDINVGVSLAASSAPHQHLTWGILGSALRGLQECLLQNGWYKEAHFQIFDSDWGHVGDGTLTSYRRTINVKNPQGIDDGLV